MFQEPFSSSTDPEYLSPGWSVPRQPGDPSLRPRQSRARLLSGLVFCLNFRIEGELLGLGLLVPGGSQPDSPPLLSSAGLLQAHLEASSKLRMVKNFKCEKSLNQFEFKVKILNSVN